MSKEENEKSTLYVKTVENATSVVASWPDWKREPIVFRTYDLKEPGHSACTIRAIKTNG